MAYIREHRRGDEVYYEEVESYRDENGVAQKRQIRWLGKTKTPPPDPITLEGPDFASIATKLLDNTLTVDDVFKLLERIGKKPVNLPELEAIGIQYDLAQKKLILHLLPKGMQWKAVPPRAPRAKKHSGAKGRKKGSGSSRSKAKQK